MIVLCFFEAPSFILNFWVPKSWELEILSSRQLWRGQLQDVLVRAVRELARERPLGKVEEETGREAEERRWRKKTYLRFLTQKITLPLIRRRDASSAVMIKPTGA